MKSKSRHTIIQRIDRNFRLGFSNVLMLFHPEKRKIYAWWEIISILFLIAFVGIIINIST